MSRYLLYTDVHWCENSSSIQSRGEKYSTRLEYLIKSVNWAENEAIVNNCEAVICLGDFFDRSDIRSEEATALQEISWVNLPHYFIVGNHDASNKSLTFNSIEVLRKLPNFNIINEPKALTNEIMFLPYIKESDITSLKDYWVNVYGNINSNKKIILSHNSVKGIQMGPVISKEGIELDEIDNFCTMFINGHLHNGIKFSKKGINLGNLTGQNFGEDASKYSHNVFILDTADNSLVAIENPYAFNFYKIEVNTENDLEKLNKLKDNAVISIKCKEELASKLKSILDTKKLIASRTVLVKNVTGDISTTSIDDLLDNRVSHLTKFIHFAKENIENSDILNYELSEICKDIAE